MKSKTGNEKIGAVAHLVMGAVIFAMGAFSLKVYFDLRSLHLYHSSDFSQELGFSILFLVYGTLEMVVRIIWLRKNKHLPL